MTIFVGYWGRGGEGGGDVAPYLDSLGRKKPNSITTNIRMEGGGQPAGVITHRKRFGVVIPRKEKECAKNDR